MSNGCQENGLWRDMHPRGPMHHWRTRAWLSLERLRPRRASRRFTRHFKRSTKSTTLSNQTQIREIPVDKRPLQR